MVGITNETAVIHTAEGERDSSGVGVEGGDSGDAGVEVGLGHRLLVPVRELGTPGEVVEVHG